MTQSTITGLGLATYILQHQHLYRKSCKIYGHWILYDNRSVCGPDATFPRFSALPAITWHLLYQQSAEKSLFVSRHTGAGKKKPVRTACRGLCGAPQSPQRPCGIAWHGCGKSQHLGFSESGAKLKWTLMLQSQFGPQFEICEFYWAILLDWAVRSQWPLPLYQMTVTRWVKGSIPHSSLRILSSLTTTHLLFLWFNWSSTATRTNAGFPLCSLFPLFSCFSHSFTFLQETHPMLTPPPKSLSWPAHWRASFSTLLDR